MTLLLKQYPRIRLILKRLKAIIPRWLPKYNEHFGQLAENVSKALMAISPSTIDRILKLVCIQYQKSGDSLMEMFAYTIDSVDIATVWGKGEKGVLEQI